MKIVKNGSNDSMFDPNAPTSASNGIFGLPFDYDSSKIILQAVPWEVTTSYGSGASLGPDAILKASHQLDLFHLGFKNAFESGFHLLPVSEHIYRQSQQLKDQAQWVMTEQVSDKPNREEISQKTELINKACEELQKNTYQQTRKIIEDKKIPGLIGGDHSTPIGQIQAVAEEAAGNYSILHIDAHHDLRNSYQGFKHSHASIFYNVMNSEFTPEKLVQVAIRDFCEEEFAMAESRDDIVCFYDRQLNAAAFSGKTWAQQSSEIVSQLGDQVYISVDIDGLSPEFCPNTGTPVPGGLSFQQFSFLIEQLVQAKKKIIGFDLVEVAPDPQGVSELDANIGARVLFELCGWTTKSNHLGNRKGGPTS